MSHLIFPIFLGTLLHLACIAIAARLAGITLQRFVVGYGPALFTLGRFQLSVLPLGGYIRFLDTRSDDVPAPLRHTAFDMQPVGRQLLVTLSGCAGLLLLAEACAGAGAPPAFRSGFVQIVSGALAPLGHAQALLAEAAAFAAEAPMTVLVGVVAAKMASLNLLPLPFMNGGAAIALLARYVEVDRFWPESLTKGLGFVMVGIWVSWGLALLVFVFTP